MTRVPTWTLAVAAVLGGVGVVVSAVMVLQPSAAPVTSTVEVTEELRPLIASYAIRNSVTALVLLIAVFLRTPSALFAAVSGRLLTELMDAARVLAEGADAGLLFVLGMITLETWVLRTLWPRVRIEMATARTNAEG